MSNNLFNGLLEEEIEYIYSHSIIENYQKNQLVFSKDDTPQYLYILLEGLIYVCDDTLDGNRNILTIIKDNNDCFGEVYLFMDINYPYYSIAMKKSQVLKIPKQLFMNHMKLTANMNKFLAMKAYTLSKKLQLLMKDNLREKIIEYLNNHQNISLKRYELADYLGVTRPALSKEIYKMIDDGILEIDENGFLKIL